MKAFAAFLSATPLLLLTAAAEAAPQTVSEIANYTGPDRQAVLEAGAKKEGEVLVYTAGTQTQPLMDAFHNKYPYIKVSVFRGETAETSKRMLEEYKAGRNVADEPNLTSDGLHVLRDAGLLQSFYSPELAMIRETAVESKHYWANDFESYAGLGYNTKEISEQDVPKNWDDLLNPKWKGKMAVGSATEKLAEFVGVLEIDRGDAFLTKLAAQNMHIYNMTGRAVANLVVSGEVALSPITSTSHVFESRQKGASIAWRSLGSVFAQVGGVSLAAKAPHPNATMLFIDYFLSKDIQSMRQKLGYASPRKDLQDSNADKPGNVIYLLERPTYQEDYEKWIAKARQLFGKTEPAPDKKS
jgi:iron(III) transport system substrate-binding protein